MNRPYSMFGIPGQEFLIPFGRIGIQPSRTAVLFQIP
jgi:hypothetical protein